MRRERSRLLRGLRIWINLLYYLAIGGGVLVGVCWPVAGITEGLRFDLSVPVAIGSSPLLPVLPLEVSPEALAATVGGESPFTLVHTRGELRFQASWLGPSFAFWVFVMLAFAIGVAGLHLLKRILAATAEGRPFDPANVGRLNLLGWILLVAGLVGPLAEFTFSRLVLRRLGPITGTPLSPPFEIREGWIASGLLVLVLAAIWKEAVRMAEEQSLTV